MDEFSKQEDAFQEKFANIEMNFEPKRLLSVSVLRTRDVSVSWISDKFDEPDPQIIVTCPSLPKPNIFRTKVQKNSPTSEINETFKFVLPQDMSRPCLVEVDLFDSDVLLDDHLGKQTFDISEYKEDTLYQKILDFTSNPSNTFFQATRGEVDLEVKIESRQHPDFRLSHGLSGEERNFRKRRIPIVYKTLNRLFPENAPYNVSETPVISLCASGGGHRAVVAMSGMMEALKDADLLDVFTYAAGLSGSAWYVSSAFTRQGYKREEQAKFHNFLRTATEENLYWKLFAPSNVNNFWKHLSETKQMHSQPASAIDFFGYTAGSLFLGEDKSDARLSDMREYVEDGTVPYPLFVALHAKKKVHLSKFHAHTEYSTHEVTFPDYGVGISPERFGSVWSSGFVVRKCPEHPIHFHQGVTASAVAVFRETDLATGEKDKHLLEYIEQAKYHVRNLDPSIGSRFDQPVLYETDDDEDEKEEQDWREEDKPTSVPTPQPRGSTAFIEESNEENSSLLEKLKKRLLDSRDSLISRTGKVFNFSLNLRSLKQYQLDPFGGTEFVGPDKEELIELLAAANKENMSDTKRVISLVDAGLYLNVPTAVLLRPQRTTDLLIVLDFSGSEADLSLDHLTLLSAAVDAWQHGLKFPPIDFEQIANLPPKECLVFEDENDLECPIVVWFTLCNKTFRNLKDYKPRCSKYASMKDFNDFPVFEPNGGYPTFKLEYDSLSFERLHELAYYNVMSNIHEVKNAIVRAIERKKKKLQRSEL